MAKKKQAVISFDAIGMETCDLIKIVEPNKKLTKSEIFDFYGYQESNSKYLSVETSKLARVVLKRSNGFHYVISVDDVDKMESAFFQWVK